VAADELHTLVLLFPLVDSQSIDALKWPTVGHGIVRLTVCLSDIVLGQYSTSMFGSTHKKADRSIALPRAIPV
jgi:hypothetical protein